VQASLIEERRQKAFDNNRAPVDDSTSASDVGKLAEYALRAPAASMASFMEKLKAPDQRAAFFGAAKSLRDGAKPGDLDAAMLDKLASAISQTSTEKDGGMSDAYGVRDGKFGDTLNASGEVLRTAADNMAAFAKSVSTAKNADKQLLKVGADALVDGQGNATEVGKVIAEAVEKNTAALSNAARNADGAAQNDTMRAIVQIIKENSTNKNLVKTVSEGRGYGNYQDGYRESDKAREAKIAEAAAEAAKAAAKAAEAAKDASKNTGNTGGSREIDLS
jgi:hypothetical protein